MLLPDGLSSITLPSNDHCQSVAHANHSGGDARGLARGRLQQDKEGYRHNRRNNWGPFGGAGGALPKALQEGGAGSENSAEAGSVKASFPGPQGPHLGRFSVPRFGPAGSPFERQLG